MELYESMMAAHEMERFHRPLRIVLTPARDCWVDLPPDLAARLLDGGPSTPPIPLPVALRLAPADPATGQPLPLPPTLPNHPSPTCAPGAPCHFVGWAGGASPGPGVLGLPAALAAALGYHDGQLCAVEPVLAAPPPLGVGAPLLPPPPHLFPPPAEAVVVEPLTESDWELVELNAGLLESGALLAQVGVVAPGQPLPLWARRNAVAALRVVAASPPGQPVLRLVPGTEVAIAPKPRGRGGGREEAQGGAVPLSNGEKAAAAPPANGRASSTTPSQQQQTTVVQEVREASDGRLTPSAALSRSASMVNGANGAVAEVAGAVAAAASSPPSSSSSARWVLRVQDAGDAALVTWDDVVDRAVAKGGGGGSRARRRSGEGDGDNATTTPQQPASSYVTTAVFVSPATAASLGLPLNAMVRLSVAPEMAAAAAKRKQQGGASSSSAAAAANAVLSRALYALLPDATGSIASPGHVLLSPPLWKALGAAPGAYVSLSVVVGGDGGVGGLAASAAPSPTPLQLLPRGCSLHPLVSAGDADASSSSPQPLASTEQALAGLARRLSKDDEEEGGGGEKKTAVAAAAQPPSIGPWAVAAWACMQAAGVLRIAAGGEAEQKEQAQQPKPAAGKPPRPPTTTATPTAAATSIALPLSTPALMQVRLPGGANDDGDHDGGGQDLLMLLVPSAAAASAGAPSAAAAGPPPPISASALLAAAAQQVNSSSDSPSSSTSTFLPPPSADLGGSLVSSAPPPLSPAAAAFSGAAASQQPQLEHLSPASTTTTPAQAAPWLTDETARAVRHVAAALDPTRWLARRRSGGVSRPPTGCLLISGPRGSGKTSLLRLLGVACARHPLHRAHSLRADCRALAGQPFARAVRALSAAAAEAAARAPSVLLLDDLDSLCFATPDGPDPALAGIAPQDAETAARLAEWLSDLAGWLSGVGGGGGAASGGGVFATPARGPVALVASVRDAAALPASLRAAGRFDTELRLPPLGAEGRAAVLVAELARLGAAAADERDVATAASAADSCDANDLRAVAGRAVHAALARRASAGGGSSSADAAPSRLTVTPSDLSAALRGFVPAALWSLPPANSSATNQLGWADIGGMGEAVAALKEVLSMSAAAAAGQGGGGGDNNATATAQRRARLVARAPLRLRTGLLLYGPPGCGKTHAVKCAAQAVGARLLSVKGPELLNKYIGASEAAVRDLFSRAAAAAPCALFFDEFDALAPPRGHDSTGVTDRVVNQLLTELDGVGGGAARAGVVVLAATSRPDLVDAALLRPGRLDRLVACDFPDEKERLEILRAGARKLADGGLAEEDLVGVAAATPSFSGADLAALLSEAQLMAVHEELERREKEKGSSSTTAPTAHRPPVVTGAHLLAAAQKARPSLPPAERSRLARVYARFASGRDPALDNRELAADVGSVGVRATLA